MDNLKKEIMRAGFSKALENKLVAQGTANNSFSGELNQLDDKVKLNQMGDITINSYTSGSSITSQALTLAQRELIADQDKYWSYTLDELDFNNDKSSIHSEAMRKAAYAANASIDTAMLALYAQAGIVRNTNASPANVNSLNVESEVIGMGEQFADAGIDRGIPKFMIVPPWFTTKLTIAAILSKSDNSELYAKGYIGSALGWDFLESNNVSIGTAATGAKTRIVCGVAGESFGYASAVTKLQSVLDPAQVGEVIVSGRFVYGAKVIRPDKTGVLYADKTAEV